MLVGPMRSGKGTIGRVLTGLMGKDNMCAPTISGLATKFGLEPLIGKQVAIIPDARLGGRTDIATAIERMLSISGEDSLTVDRKFKLAWTGRLTVRCLILTNELPSLPDPSGAIASRFVMLTLKESFLGIEDIGLTDRLLEELPGILNWAIEGLKRLTARGHFIVPDSSKQVQLQFEDLASPIRAFVREECKLGDGREISISNINGAWDIWCRAQGYNPGTSPTFGKNLHAAFPRIQKKNARLENGKREWRYLGISLLTAAEKAERDDELERESETVEEPLEEES